MPITKDTKIANRYGLNTKIFAAEDAEKAHPLLTIDFANVTDIELSGDRTWATGGQDHANKIGFNDPIEGSFKLSTQIMTMELLNLIAGGTPGEGTTSVEFANTPNTAPKYFIIESETVWQDEAGVTYGETLEFHKATPRRAFNISYSGEGDPTSVDVEFDLMQNAQGKVLKITKADQA